MLISDLSPSVSIRKQFLWSENRDVPAVAGCYAIASYDLLVLYVGLATKSIKARMADHLDSAEKRRGAGLVLPYWFYFRTFASQEVHAVERGWLNESILRDGKFPPLNHAHSPIS